MAGVLRSRKEQVSSGWKYLLGLQDLVRVYERSLVADAWLDVQFSGRQAYWKEQRDRIDARGIYSVLHVDFTTARQSYPLPEPWDDEARPLVIRASVLAVPIDALPKGVAAKSLVVSLLEELFASPPSLEEAWSLEVTLDANVRRVGAALKAWRGRHLACSSAERTLQPARR